MNPQLRPRVARSMPTTTVTVQQGAGAPAKAGTGSAGGAAIGTTIVVGGILSVGMTALLGAGAGAGISAISEGNVKKGAKWGAIIGGGVGLLGVLPFIVFGTAAAAGASTQGS